MKILEFHASRTAATRDHRAGSGSLVFEVRDMGLRNCKHGIAASAWMEGKNTRVVTVFQLLLPSKHGYTRSDPATPLHRANRAQL